MADPIPTDRAIAILKKEPTTGVTQEITTARAITGPPDPAGHTHLVPEADHHLE